MVIFMPYYRQHGPLFGSVPRPSVPNDATVPISGCKFVSSILCRFTFSLFLLIIALCLFELSIDDESNKNRGSAVIAMILLTVAIISILRTCQTLRRYYIIMNTRRRLIQRLRERQQAYDLALSAEIEENSNEAATAQRDLPTYKDLFSSQPDVRRAGDESSSPPPSYDDFVNTVFVRGAVTYV